MLAISIQVLGQEFVVMKFYSFAKEVAFNIVGKKIGILVSALVSGFQILNPTLDHSFVSEYCRI